MALILYKNNIQMGKASEAQLRAQTALILYKNNIQRAKNRRKNKR